MLLPDVPAILPSPREAVEQYPLVRYVPSRAECTSQPNWEDSDFPDHEIDSWNNCCDICREDYILPGLKIGASLAEGQHEPLRKLPCEHAYHQACIDAWLGLEDGGNTSQDACPTCRREVVDHNRTPESAELAMSINAGLYGLRSIAVSPDGGRVVLSSGMRGIFIWDTATGQISAGPLLGHDSVIRTICVSPDSRLIASGSDDTTIRVWDAVTGLPVGRPFEGHDDSVLGICFSPDGNHIASGSKNGVVCIWDVRTGCVVVGPIGVRTTPVNSVSFSPDGTMIACASADGWISLLNAATGRPHLNPTRGPGNTLSSAVFALDGTLTLYMSSSDRGPSMWTCTVTNESWDFASILPQEDVGNAVLRAISPDATQFAASSGSTISVLDSATGAVVSGPFLGHTDIVYDVVYAPGGSSIVSYSNDRTIRVWNLLPQRDAPHHRYVSAKKRVQLANSPPEDIAARAPVCGRLRSSLTFALHNPAPHHDSRIAAVHISLDSTLATSCSSDGTVHVWNIRNGMESRTFPINNSSKLSCAAISPDCSALIASGFEDGSISLHSITTDAFPNTTSLQGYQGSISAVAFSPDGRWIASGSADAVIRVSEVGSGRMAVGPLHGHRSTVRSVIFSLDGRFLASSSSDGTIRVWDAATGKPAAPPLEGHDGEVHCVAFSPDGLRLVSGGEDKTVRLWHAVAHCQLAIFRGHRDAVLSVSFSPDGMYAVSGSRDTTVRMWNVESGRQVMASLREHSAGISCVVFSADGTRLVTSDLEGGIRVWAAGGLSKKPTTQARVTRRWVLRWRDFPGLWSRATGRPFLADVMHLDGHSAEVKAIAVSPDGRHIASGSNDCTVRLWEAADGFAIGDPLGWFAHPVTAVVFSTDCTYVTAASAHGIVRIWGVDSGSIIKEFCRIPGQGITSLAYSPGGHHLAVVEDRSFTIWDITTGNIILRRPSDGYQISTVVFSPNGRCLATSDGGGRIQTWDAETGRELLKPIRAHALSKPSVIFSRDGTCLITCSLGSMICMWDTVTGEPVGPRFEPATTKISSMALSPDGSHLVGGSSSGEMTIWDLLTGRSWVQAFGARSTSTTVLAFSPDGKRVISSSGDRSVRIWAFRPSWGVKRLRQRCSAVLCNTLPSH